MASAWSRSADASTYTWQLPTPVSMTGTVDSSTTLRIRPAPPRGISTSTSPRARISALTESWLSPGTSWTTSAGRPAATTAPRRTSTMAALLERALEEPAQQDGVARLEADAGRVGGDVGPGLVDHPDDAEGHPQLAQLEAVGQRRAADHLADRVGQPGDVAQPGGHRREPVVGEAQPVDDVGRGARLLGAARRPRRWRPGPPAPAPAARRPWRAGPRPWSRGWPAPGRGWRSGRGWRPRGPRPRGPPGRRACRRCSCVERRSVPAPSQPRLSRRCAVTLPGMTGTRGRLMPRLVGGGSRPSPCSPPR